MICTAEYFTETKSTTLPFDYANCLGVTINRIFKTSNQLVSFDKIRSTHSTSSNEIPYNEFILIPFISNSEKQDNFTSLASDTNESHIVIPPQVISMDNLVFISTIKQKLLLLQSSSSIEKSLNYLFDQFNKKIIENNLTACDSLLNDIDIKDFNTTILIGFLTISFPWKNNLNSRVSLYKKVKNKLLSEYSFDQAEEILWGLE